MKLSKLEVSIIAAAIHCLVYKETNLNKKGVKKLAEIYSRMSEHLLPINAKDVLDYNEKEMLKHINYKGKKS